MVTDAKLFLIIFSLFISVNAGASTIAINIVETGTPESRSLYEYTELWEDAFMDVFFESGFIISNAPVMRFETKPVIGIFEYLFYDAAEINRWGVDYIFITQLDYTGTLRQPSEITFIIYRVKTKEIILERKIEGRTYRSTREGYDDIKSIVRGLVPFIR